jgi:hypothetical protein
LSSVAAPPAFGLWKTFRSKPNVIPPGDKNCSPSHRNRRSPSDQNAVRNHNGIVFGFRAESRSPSPEYPDVVTGVEDARNADEKEVRTHEVPEDDVPGEYLDKE